MCFIGLFCELNELMFKNELTRKGWPLKQSVGSLEWHKARTVEVGVC